MGFYRRQRKLSPEETAANAKAKAERNAAAMTCQICGRKILANTGSIAHHGYERPYDGWQTASCYGAKRLPFENECLALQEYITMLENHHAALVKQRDDVSAERAPVVFTYEKGGAWNKETIAVTVTRETFTAMAAEHASMFTRRGYFKFEQVQASAISRIEYNQRQVLADLVAQRERLGVWKHTHDFNNNTWVSI